MWPKNLKICTPFGIFHQITIFTHVSNKIKIYKKINSFITKCEIIYNKNII